ncbi:hypothetical protein [Aeromonas schubertii]|uniref:hypothetical protein n=1 Tax=Aeromonas schubertii TaxID=652 RepID=UPI000760E113|nr:hypothetical protein [Aeromonas schubertii]
MMRDDIISMIADWIQAARDAGKPSVQLQWIDPMLSLRVEDEDWFLIRARSRTLFERTIGFDRRPRL